MNAPIPPVLKELVRILVDAFDVDMDLFASRSLKAMRSTRDGGRLAGWAGTHPSAFLWMLRGASVLAHRLPKDRGLLMDALADQLSRLPAEVYRAFSPESPAPEGSIGTMDLLSGDFLRRYEAAVEDLTEDDLVRVARLSPERLREWVSSPAKMRAALLRRWEDQDAEVKQEEEQAMRRADDAAHRVAQGLRIWREDLVRKGHLRRSRL